MALTVAQLVARLSADTSGFYKSMAIANSSLLRTGGIAGRVFAGAGIAATAFGFLSLKMAGNYQQSMNVLEAVSGATTKQMKTLSDQAIRLGADFKLPNVSAKDAANAMTALAKGGLSVNQVMGATRGVLQLGIASETDFADAAVIVARALKAFGLEGSKATHIADLFTAAANASTSEMGDIALGFQMASAQFRRGQQSIEDLTTAITMMNDAGVVGSDAGTSLKTMMNRLLSPTAKAKGIMEGFGISVYNSAGNVKPMPQLIDMFSKKMRGLSNEQRNAALYTIFGSDAIRAANIVLMKGKGHWDEYSKKVNSAGAAQRMAEARTKGFNGAIQGLQSQVETLAINLGIKMLPAATKAVKAMSKFVASIDANKVAAFASALVHAVGAVVKFIAHSQVLTALLGGIVAGFVAFKVISGMVASVRAMAAAMVLLDAAMMANPFVLAAAALVGLGVALVILYKRSETFRNIVNAAFAAVKSVISTVLIPALDFLKNHWMLVLGILTGGLIPFVALVVRNFSKIKSTITTAVSAIISFVKAHWTLLLAIILGPIGIILVQIIRYWGLIRSATTTVWNAIKAVITAVVGAIVGAVTSRVLSVVHAVTSAWHKVLSLTQAIWGLIPGKVKAILGRIPGAIAGAAAATYRAAISLGRGIVTGILDGLAGLAGRVASAVGNAAKAGIGAAAGILGIHSPSTLTRDKLGKPLGQGIVVGFLMGTRDLPSTVSKAVERALTAGKAKVDKFQSQFQTMFERIQTTALSAFDAITAQNKTPTEQLLEQIDNSRTQKRLDDAVAKTQADLTDAFAAGADPKELADLQQARDDAVYEQWRFGAEKQAAAERLDYDAQRALQRQHLEDQLADLEMYLSKHPGKWKNAQEMIVNLLNGYGLTYQNIGKMLGEAYVTGLTESMGKLVKALRMIANTIAKYLKVKSPTELGPMSDLNKWWKGFGETLVQGLDTRAIEKASARMAGATVPATPYGAAMGASGPVVLQNHYHVAGSLVQERELDERIRVGVIRQEQKGKGIS